MTLLASALSVQRSYENALSTAIALRDRVTTVRDASVSAATPRVTVLGVQQSLGAAIGIWTAAAAVPGITQYARDQVDNQTYDVVAEINSVIAAATSFRDWINTNMVRNTASQTSAVLLQSADINGVTTQLTFTSLQLADFRTEATAFLATIE